MMEVKNNKFDVTPGGVDVSEAVQFFPVCLCARGEMYMLVCSTVFYFHALNPPSRSIPCVFRLCLVLVPFGFLLRPRPPPGLGSSSCLLPSSHDRAGTSSTPIPPPNLPPPPLPSHACAPTPPSHRTIPRIPLSLRSFHGPSIYVPVNLPTAAIPTLLDIDWVSWTETDGGREVRERERAWDERTSTMVRVGRRRMEGRAGERGVEGTTARREGEVERDGVRKKGEEKGARRGRGFAELDG